MYTYRTLTTVTDNGPYITKLLLDAPQSLRAEQLRPDTFSVYVERIDPSTGQVFLAAREWLGPRIYPSRGYRPVTAAYPCDEAGNRLHQSNILALEMPYGPLYPLGYAQASFQNNLNEFIPCHYRATQVREIPGEIPESGWVFDQSRGDLCPQTKGWKNDVSHDPEQPLGYGCFTPDLAHARKSFHALDGLCGDEWPHAFPEKLPLVIWLHGMGEGGTDPTVAYTGNKVVNLASDDIQRKLGGAAYILAPQSPTFWMDSGAENPLDPAEMCNSKSRYTQALKSLIDEFIRLHPDIDTDRVYIGGCSNGGFMTMRMILSYPHFFAAAYPVCEAFRNSNVTDADIQRIKHLPIWFVNADNDPIVPPDGCPLPIARRLRAAGAKNVHVSLFDRVVDQSGLFRDELGRPYEYSGHFSWVHVFNDFCMYDLDGSRVTEGGRPVTLWRWMGMQRRT